MPKDASNYTLDKPVKPTDYVEKIIKTGQKSVMEEIDEAGKVINGWLHISYSKIDEILKNRGFKDAFAIPEKTENQSLNNEIPA